MSKNSFLEKLCFLIFIGRWAQIDPLLWRSFWTGLATPAIYVSRGSILVFFSEKKFFESYSDTEAKHSGFLSKGFKRVYQIFFLILQRFFLRNKFSPGLKLFFPKKVRIFSIFLGHSVKIFRLVAKCLGMLKKACYIARRTFWLKSSFQSFFVGIGHWGNIFRILVEKFLNRCQNCVLHVEKNVLSRSFFSNFLKILSRPWTKKLVVGRKTWQCCQNCIPRLQRVILKEIVKKVVFPISFGHWEKSFGRFTKSFPAGGSKLHSAFHKEQFEEIFPIYNFFPVDRTSRETFIVFW